MFLGPNTRVHGRIDGSVDFEVQGYVEGTIDLDATLIVAATGYVVGDIRARKVVVEGAVAGSITASEIAVFAKGAQIQADLSAPAFEMHDGAKFAGKLAVGMQQAATTRATTERRAPVVAETRRPVVAEVRATTSTPAPRRAELPRVASTPPRTELPRVSSPAPRSAAPVRTTPVRTAPVVTASPVVTPAPVVARHVELPQPAPVRRAPTVSERHIPAPLAAPAVTHEVRAAEVDEEVHVVTVSAAREARSAVSRFQHLTVRELRERLRDLDLPVSGTKAELQDRLESTL